MRRLQLVGAIRSKVHIINDVVTFAVLAEPKEILAGEKVLSDARRAHLRQRFNIAPWSFAAGLYGTRSQVNANIAEIKRQLGRLGTLQFIDDRKIAALKRIVRGLRAGSKFRPTRPAIERFALTVLGKPLALLEMMPNVHAIEKGFPSDYFVKHAYYRSRRPKPADHDIDPARDQCGLIWLGPMVPLNGREVTHVLDLVQAALRETRIRFHNRVDGRKRPHSDRVDVGVLRQGRCRRSQPGGSTLFRNGRRHSESRVPAGPEPARSSWTACWHPLRSSRRCAIGSRPPWIQGAFSPPGNTGSTRVRRRTEVCSRWIAFSSRK